MVNINSKQIEKVMKQMGMSQEEISAKRVIIEKEDGNIIVESPQVTKIKMQGQETFQVVGNIVEEENTFTEEDVSMVVEKTNANEEEVRKFLEDNEGDIAKAIIELKK